jgi:hypothetical protein
VADYLTRLVERTLGLSPTAQPEIPPTFAPEAGNPPPPAPDADAGGYSPPTDNRTTRRADDPPQRPEPPERSEEDTPLVQRNEEDGPNLVEWGNGPTTGRPFGTKNVEERAVIEHHPTGAEREGDETPRGPEGHRQSPTFVPPDTAASDEAARRARWEPEGSKVAPDRRGVPSSEPLTGPSETIRDDDNGPDERPSETDARPAKRPGGRALLSSGDRPGTDHDEPAAERGEPDISVSQSRREAQPSSARAHTAPPTDAVDPGGRARPGREWLVTQDRPVSQTAGREEHDRTSDPSASVVAPHQRRGAEKETPSPTVRITIGRVEVRAILPEPVAAQPPTEARSEPALSLEDYLKQPSGGRW